MRVVLGLVGVLALAACASKEPAAPGGERRVTYSCELGSDITVVYSPGQARIEGANGGGMVLPQKPSGSGFWYESPTHSLRGKGDEVSYTVGRMVPMTCRAH